MIDALAQAGIMALEFILVAMTNEKDEEIEEGLSLNDGSEDQIKEPPSVDMAAGSGKDNT